MPLESFKHKNLLFPKNKINIVNFKKDIYKNYLSMEIPNPNLINIDGPKITIAFKDLPAKEAISFLYQKLI